MAARDHAQTTCAATPKSAATEVPMRLFGEIALPARRANPKLVQSGGIRRCLIWKVPADNSYQLEFRTGKSPVRRVRFHADTFAALASILGGNDPSEGSVWTVVAPGLKPVGFFREGPGPQVSQPIREDQKDGLDEINGRLA